MLRKKWGKKSLLLITLVFIVSIVLSGCSGGKSGQPTEQAKQDDWPTKEVRLIVPYDAGGAIDTQARQMQPFLEKELGVPLVIDNRTGGSGVIGTTLLSEADPDGYTIGMFTSPGYETSMLTMDPKFGIDDLSILCITAQDPGLLRARKDAPFNNFQELIDYMKKNPPGTVSVSVTSRTVNNYLGLKDIEQKAGVEFNIVPYSGGGPARLAVVGGQVDLTHCNTYNSLSIAKDTKVIAVQVEENKLPELTDNAQTVGEVLGQKVLNTGAVYGFFAPAALKEQYPERYEKLVKAIENVCKNPDYVAVLAKTQEEGKIDYKDTETAEKYIKDSYEEMKNFVDLMKE